MRTVTALVAVAIALPGLLTTVHLIGLALASLAHRPPRRAAGASAEVRLLVVIPAHDEEAVIGATLAAVHRAMRPVDEVLVVADRCSDATADIARSHRAIVLERSTEAAHGRAEARQAGLDMAAGLQWDAVVMIDADSIVEPGFFDACARAVADGAPAAQARSEASLGGGLVALTTLLACTVQGVLVPRGRQRLGLAVRLRGTGMVLRRDIALAHRFTAPASEDLVYTLELLLHGVRARHLEDARLRAQSVDRWGDLGVQRVRYEAGRLAAARHFVPRLLARPTPSRLEAALFLLSAPFATSFALLGFGGGLAALAGAPWWSGTCLAAATGLGAVLVVAMLEARTSPAAWLALATAPWYVAWKVVVQLRAALAVLHHQQHFPATARGGLRTRTEPGDP